MKRYEDCPVDYFLFWEKTTTNRAEINIAWLTISVFFQPLSNQKCPNTTEEWDICEWKTDLWKTGSLMFAVGSKAQLDVCYTWTRKARFLPICPGRGEWGRGRVGDVLVRIRLFLLLVRQLQHTQKQAGNKSKSVCVYKSVCMFPVASEWLIQAKPLHWHLRYYVTKWSFQQLTLRTWNNNRDNYSDSSVAKKKIKSFS